MSKKIHTDITIAAPAGPVFKALADFDAYPSWNPFIRSIQGTPAKGEKLKITLQIPGSGRMRSSATVLVMDENKEIRWKGHLRLPGLFNSDTRFTIEEQTPGVVTFSQTAEFSGILHFLFSEKLRKNRELGFREMNMALKRLVESRMILETETVDRGAPVTAVGEVEVEASLEAVWDLLTDINKWPVWNHDVRWARIVGPFHEGAVFVWKAGPGKIRSTIRRILPGKLISWTGSTLGIKAVHIWKLEAKGASTIVTTEESWNGPAARLFRKTLQRKLETSIEDGLEHLKRAFAKS
jgi:hypothetical protein